MKFTNSVIQVQIKDRFVSHLVLTEPQGKRKHVIVAPILPQIGGQEFSPISYPLTKSQGKHIIGQSDLTMVIEGVEHRIGLEALYAISLLQAEIASLDESQYVLPKESLVAKKAYLSKFVLESISIRTALFPYDESIKQKKRPVINISNTNFYITTKKNENQIIIDKMHPNFNITKLKETSYIELHRCIEALNARDKIIGYLPTDIAEEFKTKLKKLFEIE